MIFNYIKIAWRNLTKQKLFSLINITGLATGLAVCMMIMMYVAHEMSYDRFHKNADLIFMPQGQIKQGSTIMNMQYMSYAAGPLIQQSQPTVKAYIRTLAYFNQNPVVVNDPSSPGKKFIEDKLLFADPGFFNFFSFKLLLGSTNNVLKRPFSVVLSRDMAKKYFGGENPVGKTIMIKTDSTYTYQVTGVAENAPSNSSIDFNFVASNASLLAMKEAARYTGDKHISFGAFGLYLLLKNASDTARLARGMDLVAKKDKDFDNIKFSFNALVDSHLKNDFGDQSNIRYLKIFPLVAVLILLLALVNYMSLSTARATLRAKEVGVRKVSGASRKTIAIQFYVESAVFTCISFVLGYFLCYFITPWFLSILQLKIDNSFLYSPLVLILLFSLLVITILIAGFYPSMVLSAFKPVITLKGKMSKQAGGVTVRKVFTTLQFAISIGLIVCGIVIDRQLYYFRHADTGINKDNVVMIPIGNSVGKKYSTLKQEIQSLAGVSNVATSNYAMFKSYNMNFFDGKTKGEAVGAAAIVADENFMATLGLKWKYPPAPNAALASRNKTIINEETIAELHLPANPVGSVLKSGDQKITVSGVLKDFKFTSMAYAVKPLSLVVLKDTDSYFIKFGCNLFARISPHTNLPTLLGKMQAIYKKYDQDTPFDYTFMDDAFNAQYKADDRLASIFGVFTYVTIILAALGLFGLAAFTIEQRTKEIGIRKVLGASVSSINNLLSKDFLKLVFLANAIASPIAWWAMRNWLQNFAYRISISWWMFAAAGFVAIVTAVLMVSYHAVRAAMANPVDSLRSE
ncbi:ABC transporter permease [uncultured Mucilaginibacter sp.]|uniref:ABC transporter permease n=1 Tax=uncultured Mucilaginibacter sp. TaxID=797541 RepID=UPI0025E2FBFF|nr:ABC transporter permease [uncultured Mucilaginibacter sp.]